MKVYLILFFIFSFLLLFAFLALAFFVIWKFSANKCVQVPVQHETTPFRVLKTHNENKMKREKHAQVKKMSKKTKKRETKIGSVTKKKINKPETTCAPFEGGNWAVGKAYKKDDRCFLSKANCVGEKMQCWQRALKNNGNEFIEIRLFT